MANTELELIKFSAFVSECVDGKLTEKKAIGFREEAFSEFVVELLSDAGETGHPQICTSVFRNRADKRLRQMNAYALWDNFETLDLFITDYRGDKSIYTLEKSRIKSNFNLAEKYLQFVEKGQFEEVDESAVEMEFLQNFADYKDELLRVRIILLTDGIVKTELPEIFDNKSNLRIVYEIWDLQRISKLWLSQHKRTPIEIDFKAQFNEDIKCLTIPAKTSGHRVFLAIIPGNLLADLYDLYGSRLLEQNVRSYLQNVGKVNKEMRKTILGKSEMFLAYNNGISATVTDIKLENSKQEVFNVIKKVKGLQIVNGGQTTSSIYYARQKGKATLENVFVQMKITLVGDDKETEAIISRISKFANSQNKVSEIDLTSNQTYNITLEELSRITWAPSKGGISHQTRWYYERVKGQYNEEINKEHNGETKRKKFKQHNPASQIIRKEELAKFKNSWNGLPHSVVKGSQKNYLQFIQNESNIEPDRLYFRSIVSLAILFKKAEIIYGVKPNAMGDLRFIVVPYAIAWINYNTPDRIDLEKIWRQQDLSPALEKLLRTVLLSVNNFFLTEKPEQFSLVGEWAKREECWQQIRIVSRSRWAIDFDLISKDIVKSDSSLEDINSYRENEEKIRNTSIKTWELIERFGVEKGILNQIQIGVVRNLSQRLQKGKKITEQLVNHAAKILDIYHEYLGSK
jgi:hypothetical protein